MVAIFIVKHKHSRNQMYETLSLSIKFEKLFCSKKYIFDLIKKSNKMQTTDWPENCKTIT